MDLPKPPAGLKAPGKALWTSIVSDVPADLELDARDLAVLGEACRLADTAAALQRAIDRDGVVAKGAKGQPRLNGAVTALTTARRSIPALLAQVDMGGGGVTPAQQRASQAARSRPLKSMSRRTATGRPV
jgi:hypothetical protein